MMTMKNKNFERWYSIPENRIRTNKMKRERMAYVRKKGKEYTDKLLIQGNKDEVD